MGKVFYNGYFPLSSFLKIAWKKPEQILILMSVLIIGAS